MSTSTTKRIRLNLSMVAIIFHPFGCELKFFAHLQKQHFKSVYVSSRVSQRKNLVLKSIHRSALVETCILFYAGPAAYRTNPARRRKLLLHIIYLHTRQLHSPDHFPAGLAVATPFKLQAQLRRKMNLSLSTSFITITATPC